jgi:hypothetical protein
VCPAWLHGGQPRDVCPFCDKPFIGKQKFVGYGVCDIGIHWVCLQLSEADQAAITATGKSAFKRDACAKTLGPSSNDKAPVKFLCLMKEF